MGLHGSVREALVSHLLHDGRGHRRPSGESLFGSSAASQVQEPPVLVWGPIISATSVSESHNQPVKTESVVKRGI